MADRILLVDDDADLLAAFERMLRKHFAIDTAVGGVDGLKMFAQPSQYAVVVSDMRMPDRKSTRLNSSHIQKSRMPSSA